MQFALQVREAATTQIPCLLLKGSGKAADILADAVSISDLLAQIMLLIAGLSARLIVTFSLIRSSTSEEFVQDINQATPRCERGRRRCSKLSPGL